MKRVIYSVILAACGAQPSTSDVTQPATCLTCGGDESGLADETRAWISSQYPGTPTDAISCFQVYYTNGRPQGYQCHVTITLGGEELDVGCAYWYDDGELDCFIQ